MLGSVVVALFFYPISKTFWSAIDLIMTPLDPSELQPEISDPASR